MFDSTLGPDMSQGNMSVFDNTLKSATTQFDFQIICM